MIKSDKNHFISCKNLLYFYKEAGVKTVISENSINRFSVAVNKQPATIVSTKIKSNHIHVLETVRNANSLEELKEKLEAFDGCHLKIMAKNTCFADGTPGSDIMLIGEAPGRDEDIQALPFVGRSGKLLNLMLAAIGLQRDQVYIANTIPWRPPGNRTPTLIEIELCRPFLDRQIELAHPKILIALGGPASKSLTGSKESILRMRGHWHCYQTIGGIKIPVMPTLHPAYLLRRPTQKKLAWQDFLSVKQRLSKL